MQNPSSHTFPPKRLRFGQTSVTADAPPIRRDGCRLGAPPPCKPSPHVDRVWGGFASLARFTLRRQKKRFGDVLVVPCFDEDRGRTHGDVDEAFSSSSSHVRTCDKNNAYARMATSSYRIVRTRRPCTPGPSVSLSPPRPCRHLRGSQGGEGPGPSLSPRAKGNDSLTRKESSANKGRGGYVLADHGGGALHPLCWGRSLGEIAGVRGEGVVSSRLRGVEGRRRRFAGGGEADSSQGSPF